MNINIANRFQSIRIDYYKETLKKFSEKAGILQAHLSKIERGKANISFKVLLNLSKLGISLDWLFTGTGDMFRDSRSTCILEKRKGTCPVCQKKQVTLYGVDSNNHIVNETDTSKYICKNCMKD